MTPKRLAILILVFSSVGGIFIFKNSEDVILSQKQNKRIYPQKQITSIEDIENQRPLFSPPTIVRGVYLTRDFLRAEERINAVVEFIKKNNLNGVVLDIKDYSGYLTYKAEVPEAKKIGAEEMATVLRPNTLIKKLHDENIYIIGRISVFQDQIFAKNHPELALRNKLNGESWLDDKMLMWLDPAAQAVWKYNVDIAREALSRGFDEINFDYLRFPSDGNLEMIDYPIWGKLANQSDKFINIPTKRQIILSFFKYVRDNLADAKISADLFGMTTLSKHDLGIGQIIEDAFQYFDYINPMIYPSHYAAGFMGYKNPAAHPYEVVKYSLEGALVRLTNYLTKPKSIEASTTSTSGEKLSEHLLPLLNSVSPKIRPWLQAFSLGAFYDKQLVKEEIRATLDAFGSGQDYSKYYAGWLLWNPSSDYAYLGESLK